MKYAVIVCDGMSDKPVEQLNGKTPLSAADTPVIDRLFAQGRTGIVKLSPPMSRPDRIICNMSVLGYFPKSAYGGGSALEAIAEDIDIGNDDVVFFCDFVSLEDGDSFESSILSHRCDDISEDELHTIVDLLNSSVDNEIFRFYASENKRSAFLVWKKGEPEAGQFFSPESAAELPVRDHLPKGDFTPIICSIMKKSYMLLKNHPVNERRTKQGKAAVTTAWIWCIGKKPDACDFTEKYGKSISVVSDDKTLAGLAKLMGMNTFFTESFENIDFQTICKNSDIIYLHTAMLYKNSIDGDFSVKKSNIEKIDKKIIAPLLSCMEGLGDDFSVMVLSSATVSCEQKQPDAEPVPYFIFDSKARFDNSAVGFNERSAFDSGNYVPYGASLIEDLIKN